MCPSLDVLRNYDIYSHLPLLDSLFFLNPTTFKSVSLSPAFSLNCSYLSNWLLNIPLGCLVSPLKLNHATAKLTIFLHHSSSPGAPNVESGTASFMPLFKPKSSLIFVSIVTYSTSGQSTSKILPALPSKYSSWIQSQPSISSTAYPTTLPPPPWSKPAVSLTWTTLAASILITGRHSCSLAPTSSLPCSKLSNDFPACLAHTEVSPLTYQAGYTRTDPGSLYPVTMTTLLLKYAKQSPASGLWQILPLL